MKKIKIIVVSLFTISCILGIGAYVYTNSNTFLINKYIDNCMLENPTSPDYCKCSAYFNSEFNKDIFKRLAYANKYAVQGIIASLPQDKKDIYVKDTNNICREHLSDEDFISTLSQNIIKPECTRYAYYRLPEFERYMLKRYYPKNDKNFKNILSLFADLVLVCSNKQISNEEYKNKFRYRYFLDNDVALSDKCLDSLSDAELKSYDIADIKTLLKIEECENYEDGMKNIGNIITYASWAKIKLIEKAKNIKLTRYRKNHIRKKFLNCMEEKINKLSENELQKFKDNFMDSEITKTCMKEKIIPE